MGLFRKRAADADEVARLRSEIAAMAERLEAADARLGAADARLEAADRRLADAAQRLDAVDSDKAALGEEVRGIVRRLETPLTPPPDVPPPTAPADDTALDEVRDRLAALAERLDAVDHRIASISTELANQIDELSGELDAVVANRPTSGDGVDAAVLDELRDAQTRLANEQARYQIAFRQDLADLAHRLRSS